MTDDGHRMSTRSLVIFRRNKPAQSRLHAQHLKEVAGDYRSSLKVCLVVTVQTGCNATPGDHSVKDLILIAQFGVVGVREHASRSAIENVDQSFRIEYWESPHQRGINQAEYRTVRANAQREREQRNCGKR